MKNLAPENLLNAYASGYFPMVTDGELWWYTADPRAFLPLDERLHIPRRLGRTIRSGRFVCTVNRAFPDVMALCATDRADGNWISAEIIAAYTKLHELGFAHSVEAWEAGSVGCGQPVGGLYGVQIGGAFFAESMFHRKTDAGKVALMAHLARLVERGFDFCDVQWHTDNLAKFGLYELSDEDYRPLLAAAISKDILYV
ncbi:MAG: leucyl/phenylalanyl-tRNA--protein transferase [Phycisphaerales bacterium]|nr:leucyl/phenylalanyl-tRNA--protein transferase [Phycisphaerales bacterium]MBT7171939.1 leucyl/phenylalanyl-tRNA--protein transferase [Phycisphaerales bacterium]